MILCHEKLNSMSFPGFPGFTPSWLYDRRDDFNFHTVNFLFFLSNVPHSPSFGV